MDNYKSTLNLPNTKFPMRANLTKIEPKILECWFISDIYNLIRTTKQGKKIFILHDGPPYANGDIHIGHAINKVLKDIIIKSKWLSGFDAIYIPGWDCHGLPIEREVEITFGRPGNDISTNEFRKKCRDYTKKQILSQKKDFIRLGVIGDWKNAYSTMDFKIEANIIRTLAKIISKKHLYRGIKPVRWCLNCISALAEAEIEFYEKKSLAVYVMFKVLDQLKIKTKFRSDIQLDIPIYLVVWTTTLWTIPVNRAIALNPNFSYLLIQIKEKALIIAENLIYSVLTKIGVKEYKVLGECKGYNLKLQNCQHPFLDYYVPILLSEHITLEMGTGIVHVAPEHGPDDYEICVKYNIKTINYINHNGYYRTGIHPQIDGINIFNIDKVLIDLLRINNSLLYKERIKHRYPHCWRHKTPVIFFATPQWFISMDKNGIREQALQTIKDIKWIPYWGEERIRNMLINRPDWCISRQRVWGVPMPLLIHKENGQLHPNILEIMEKVAKLVEKRGAQVWWDLNLHDLIDDDAQNYVKVNDIIDVWFDSGSISYSEICNRPTSDNDIFDLYLEGSDQYRGWFMSSLIISIAINNTAPCQQILSHGFAVDNQGFKMSKSIGNTISPQSIINKFGADILRLWIASVDFSKEMSLSKSNIQRSIDNYRRIRNTIRFMISNLYNFDPTNDLVTPENMVAIDCWAINHVKNIQQKIILLYKKYSFYEVVKKIIQFCSVEMSSFYLDIIKDRLYTNKYNSIAYRSCQTALWYISESIVRWIAPIISFTADELWNYLPGKREQYVFIGEWFQNSFLSPSDRFSKDDFWRHIIEVRNEINKIIDQVRCKKNINSTLEMSIIIYVDNPLFNVLISLGDELKFVLIVSEAKVLSYNLAPKEAKKSEKLEKLKIIISRVQGTKCPRCWHYTNDFIDTIKYSKLCVRCVSNLLGSGEKRKFI